MASLSGKREAVALLLTQGLSAEQVAAQTGVGKRTIFRWGADPEFAAALAAMRKQLVTDTMGRLTGMLAEATEQLHELVKDKDAQVRLRAVRTVYEQQRAMVELHDLAAQVAELRRLVESDRKARREGLDPRRNGAPHG